MARRVVNKLVGGSLQWSTSLKSDKFTTFIYKIKGSPIARKYVLKLYAGGHVIEDSIVLRDSEGILTISNNGVRTKYGDDYVFELYEQDCDTVPYSQYFDVHFEIEDNVLMLAGENTSGMDFIQPMCWVILHRDKKPVGVVSVLFPGIIKPGGVGFSKVSLAQKDYDRLEVVPYVYV